MSDEIVIIPFQNSFLQLALQSMNILLLDNYDSFTYNLLHLLEQFDGIRTEVKRNDEITVGEAHVYDRIVLSPGPGLPSDAGVMNDIIRIFYNQKPILGICLGMQAMAEVFGGRLNNIPKVFHGVAINTLITDVQDDLFHGISSPFLAGRYHSWCVDRELPDGFKITAIDEAGYVMGISHRNKLMHGVQFHPESIMTDCGKTIISNWLVRC
jgi:anthranilate synthase component 2